MANEKNLKPFPPGQSGNPAGYSSRRRLADALIKAIEALRLDDALVQVGLREALKGDFRFWSYIFDRVDGKVSDQGISQTDLSAEDDQAIRVYLFPKRGAKKPTTKPKP